MRIVMVILRIICGNVLWEYSVEFWIEKGKFRGIRIWIWMDCHGDFEGEIKRDVKG